MLPDTSDIEKMLHIGRMTVLRRARKDVAKRLRDRIVPMLNAIEGEQQAWEVSDVAELVEEINQINRAIEALN